MCDLFLKCETKLPLISLTKRVMFGNKVYHHFIKKQNFEKKASCLFSHL